MLIGNLYNLNVIKKDPEDLNYSKNSESSKHYPFYLP
jgi:hypothetical protein